MAEPQKANSRMGSESITRGNELDSQKGNTVQFHIMAVDRDSGCWFCNIKLTNSAAVLAISGPQATVRGVRRALECWDNEA